MARRPRPIGPNPRKTHLKYTGGQGRREMNSNQVWPDLRPIAVESCPGGALVDGTEAFTAGQGRVRLGAPELDIPVGS